LAVPLIDQLFERVISDLLTAVEEEPTLEVLLALLNSLQASLVLVGMYLKPVVFERMKIAFEELLNKFLKKRNLFQQSEERDSYELSSIDFHRDVFIKTGEVIAKCVEVCGPDVLQFLTDACSVYKNFLGENAQVREQFISIYLFNSLVEFGGPVALTIYQSWVPYVIQILNSSQPGLRRAASMGVSLLAEFASDVFPQVLADSINRLNAAILSKGSRESASLSATQTAIATVGRIIQFHANAIDLKQVLPIWLSYLPVSSMTDAQIIHQQLCVFFVQHTEIILGENFSNLLRILQLFAGALGTPLVSQETHLTMISILKQMQTDFPADLMQQAWLSLNLAERGFFFFLFFLGFFSFFFCRDSQSCSWPVGRPCTEVH
jgi:hypothetical protein